MRVIFFCAIVGVCILLASCGSRPASPTKGASSGNHRYELAVAAGCVPVGLEAECLAAAELFNSGDTLDLAQAGSIQYRKALSCVMFGSYRYYADNQLIVVRIEPGPGGGPGSGGGSGTSPSLLQAGGTLIADFRLGGRVFSVYGLPNVFLPSSFAGLACQILDEEGVNTLLVYPVVGGGPPPDGPLDSFILTAQGSSTASFTWAPAKISAQAAWDRTMGEVGGTPVYIAAFDSGLYGSQGIGTLHPDLQGRVFDLPAGTQFCRHT
jgi:hypothetical protein